MPSKPLTRESLPYYFARLERLEPSSQRRWGKLTPHRLLTHLKLTMQMSIGEIDVEPLPNMAIMRNPVVRWLIVKVLPWPHDKIKAPDVLTPAAANDFQTERENLKEAMKRFVERAEAEPELQTSNPGFGKITLSFWESVHGRHLTHHLEQFGLG